MVGLCGWGCGGGVVVGGVRVVEGVLWEVVGELWFVFCGWGLCGEVCFLMGVCGVFGVILGFCFM